MGTTPYREFNFIGGIDNVNPVRGLHPNFLTEGKNIDIDNIGYITIRDGQIRKSAVATHSLWANSTGSISLFVQGTELKTNIDNPVTIRTGLTANLPMAYAEFNNQIVYSNNEIIEYVDGLKVTTFDSAFAAQMAADPKPYKAVMKAGRLLDFFNGRLYVVRGGIIRWSDALTFTRFDTRFFYMPVSGDITMWKSVTDGIWASWGGKTYFIAGAEPKDFVIIEKADYGAIGQAIEVMKELVGITDDRGFSQFSGGNTIIWVSSRGICIGGDGGVFRNISIGRYKIRDNVRHAVSLFRVKNGGIPSLISIMHN